MREQGPEGGWARVADRDGAATLIDALLELDPDAEYTKSELADHAGVPLKRLYLAETVEWLAGLGVLVPVDTDGEDRYTIDPDAEVYQRAAAFDAAVAQVSAD